jgi:hypothetical protein
MRLKQRRIRASVSITCLLLLTFQLGSAQTNQTGAGLKAVYANGKWGYADQAGRVVIAPQFDAARPFSNGLAQVAILDEELPEIRSSPNLKWGYIDERGRVLVELRYAVLRPFFEGLAAAARLDPNKPERPTGRGDNRLNLTWGYIDQNGREVIPLQFLTAGDFAEGLARVNPSDVGGGKDSFCGPPANYGYINKSAVFVIKPQFTHAAEFQNGRARVSVGRITYVGRCVCCAPRFVGKHGFIDKDGKFTAEQTGVDDADFEEDWEIRR